MKTLLYQQVNAWKQFVFSQYFYDGLKITLAVILPAVIAFQLDALAIGVTISLGSLLTSVSDTPGPVIHRRNAMLATVFFLFVNSVIIGFLNQTPLLLFFVIPAFCLFFSMFTVYGARASSVGIASLLALVITLDQQMAAWEIWVHALFLVLGGFFYFALSMLLTRVFPYRPAEQLLGETIQLVADNLRVRSKFYQKDAQLEATYSELISQQASVNESFEHVRELLFKTRQILRDSSAQGNRLIMTFVELVDLYEQTNEKHIDYDAIHADLGKQQILPLFHDAIQQIATHLDYIGTCIHNHQAPNKQLVDIQSIDQLNQAIENLSKEHTTVFSLRKIFLNLVNIRNSVIRMYDYQIDAVVVPDERRRELHRFTAHVPLDTHLFRENLTLKSSVFRHSLRVAIVAALAYLFTQTFYDAAFSYWILLTVVVIMKPGFSQTKQKNKERIIGTISGGLLGVVLLHYIDSVNAKFAWMLLFMLLTYSLTRLNYIYSVFFMTPFILFAFSFLGHQNDVLLAKERILDTVIAVGLSWGASWVLFPNWEAFHLKKNMAAMLEKNGNYLDQVLQFSLEDAVQQANYRLARKESYVAISNATSTLQRMLGEPKRKQRRVNEVNKLILLNNIFNAHLAAMMLDVRTKQSLPSVTEKSYRKIQRAIHQSIRTLGEEPMNSDVPAIPWGTTDHELIAGLLLLVKDMRKMTTALASESDEARS